MIRITGIILAAMAAILLFSCEEKEPYDNPFVYVIQADDSTYAASSTVSSQAAVVRTYYICLSSKILNEDLVVDYSFTVGDGLTAGVDFERITTGNQAIFQPGVFAIPIRIRWLPNTVDAEKDNSITIRIESSNLGITLGFPGPDQLSRQHTIRKVNM